jgi:hypothetical protein
MECAAIVVSCHALPCDDNSVCPLLVKEISSYLQRTQRNFLVYVEGTYRCKIPSTLKDKV